MPELRKSPLGGLGTRLARLKEKNRLHDAEYMMTLRRPKRIKNLKQLIQDAEARLKKLQDLSDQINNILESASESQSEDLALGHDENHRALLTDYRKLISQKMAGDDLQ